MSFKTYTSLINSFKFIHCFLPKQSKRSLLSPVIHPSNISTWKCLNICNWQKLNKTLICENLENTNPLGQKYIFFILLGLTTTKCYRNIFTYSYQFLRKSFQATYNDNPAIVSGTASKSIFTASNFWTDYRSQIISR